METLLQDLRYGARILLKNRGFSAVAIAALALGIGANSAIFSVANALLLKPLPFENLDRLVAIRESLPDQGLKAKAVSPADFADWRDQSTVFQGLAAYRPKGATITGGGDPELAAACFVSADFFQAIETRAMAGRTPAPEEDQPGSGQVVVLGYGLWQRRFAADSGVLGTSMLIDGRATTIIGIMPPDYSFPYGAELWMPLAMSPRGMKQRDVRDLQVLAQLKPGVSASQAQAEMLAISKRLEQQYPQTNAGVAVQVIPLRDQQAAFMRPLVSVPAIMAGLLLLIACANVANMLYARATTRQKEIAIRSALGASRPRLVRQLLTEGLVLSILAGALGLMLATWAVDVIKASLPPGIARFMMGWKEINVDGRVLVFTLAAAFLTTLIFSLPPALQASRPDVNETLKDGGRSGATSRGRRARGVLVMLETALALVLLVGAGLIVKGFSRTLNLFEGADPGRILTMESPLPETKYDDDRKVAEFYGQVVKQMEALPEVQSVAVASNTPLNNRPNPSIEISIEGRPGLLPGERQPADLLVVSPNYFSTIGASMLRGRDFNESDGRNSTQVAIISEITARRYFTKEDPLGRRIKRAGSDAAPWLTIVGVASDVKQSWFDNEIRPQLYLPAPQSPQRLMAFLLRTRSDPMSVVPAARSQILSVDQEQPIDEVKTLARLFVDETSPLRFAAGLMLVFGAIALLLSAVGVYGVMSYSVAQRSHEIGIRMALGAKRSDVLRLIVGHGVRMAALGLAIGLPLALVLSKIMAGLLFGVVTFEPAVLLGFASLLALIAFASSYIPAHRAAGIDPMKALRRE
jgi:putative ABC transport system permease protein